jgi:hypothetical protein
MHDAAEHTAVVHSFNASDIRRQVGFNARPLFIGQPNAHSIVNSTTIPIKVVALHLASLQRHCEFSTLRQIQFYHVDQIPFDESGRIRHGEEASTRPKCRPIVRSLGDGTRAVEHHRCQRFNRFPLFITY